MILIQSKSVYVPVDAPPVVDDPITIEVKVVAVDDNDEVRGQFDNGDDTTIPNLLVYLHNC